MVAAQYLKGLPSRQSCIGGEEWAAWKFLYLAADAVFLYLKKGTDLACWEWNLLSPVLTSAFICFTFTSLKGDREFLASRERRGEKSSHLWGLHVARQWRCHLCCLWQKLPKQPRLLSLTWEIWEPLQTYLWFLQKLHLLPPVLWSATNMHQVLASSWDGSLGLPAFLAKAPDCTRNI